MIAKPRFLLIRAEKKDLFSHYSGSLPSIKALLLFALLSLLHSSTMTAAEDAAAAAALALAASNTGTPAGAAPTTAATTAGIPAVASIPVPIAKTRWVSNPNQGDINPGTSEGAKRFKAATTPLAEDKRLSVRVENSVKAISHLKHHAQLNSWQDSVIINVGTLANPILKNVFDHHRDITLDQLKDNAWKSFGDDPTIDRDKTASLHAKILDPNAFPAHETIFYSRVMLELIGQVILGHIDTNSMDTLSLQEEHYQWILVEAGRVTKKHDGLTMLKLILDELRPSTNVGVSKEKHLIETARMAAYKENVKALLDSIEIAYQTIRKQEPGYEWDLRHLYDALTSGRNQTFKDFIQRRKDDWEVGNGITSTELIREARMKYANSTAAETQTEHRDTMIAALNTRIRALEDTRTPGANSNPRGGGNAPTAKGTAAPRSATSVDAWRLVKVGETVNRDDRTWHWCKEHRMDGVYDGMYVLHPPSGHAEWQADKDRKKVERGKANAARRPVASNPTPAAASNPAASNPAAQKLALSDSLRAALVTDHAMSPEAVDALMAEHSLN
jgi:hypothetical protein